MGDIVSVKELSQSFMFYSKQLTSSQVSLLWQGQILIGCKRTGGLLYWVFNGRDLVSPRR